MPSEILVSTSSQLDNTDPKTSFKSYFSSLNVVSQRIGTLGLDGLQVQPTRFINFQIKYGRFNNLTKRRIKAAEQSFRGETFRDAVRGLKNGNLRPVIFYASFPETISSLKNLVQLQKKIGQDIPTVVYHPKADGLSRDFSKRLIQPSSYLAKSLFCYSSREFGHLASLKGFNICLDLAHFRMADQINQGNWRLSLPEITPYIGMVHFSVGRTDLGDKLPFNTVAELRESLTGRGNTDLFRMVRTIKDYGFVGPWVIETLAPEIKKQGFGVDEGILSIANNLRDII